jgi:hypothetical protein
MNRVWKRFFLKVAEPVSYVLYFVGTMLLAEYMESKYGMIAFMGIWGVMVVLPVLGWMLKEMYRQAKREIDFENEELLRELKGK